MTWLNDLDEIRRMARQHTEPVVGWEYLVHGLADEADRLRRSYGATCDTVEQTLGAALGYPPGPAGGVSVGGRSPEQLAGQAADELHTTRRERALWQARYDRLADEHDEWMRQQRDLDDRRRAEIEVLRAKLRGGRHRASRRGR